MATKKEHSEDVKEAAQQKAADRIFTLLEKLRRGRYTFEQLMRFVGKSRSVTYSYIKFLRNKGYNIEQDKDNGTFSLINSEGKGFDSLGEEERDLVQNALLNYAPNNLLVGGILKKLLDTGDLALIADELVSQQDYDNLRLLLLARDQQKRVLLRGYQSTHSTRLSDRVFEPKILYAEQQKIHGCEINTGRTQSKTKTFNLERIGQVVLLDESQSFTLTEEITDIFGWSGTEPRVFEFRMTKRAKLILEKDFPSTRIHIRDDGGDKFRIRGTYTGVEFITRFILSLPNEIEVLHDSFLRTHLNSQVSLFKKF